ncbi:hypothetical protein G6703_02200 [Polynucleobacter paneuropaeus]|nr:hypothetical protein G6703_02200 [Polynucleobacter paneuropaeus]
MLNLVGSNNEKEYFFLSLVISTNVLSSSYECVVTRKLDFQNNYSQSEIDKFKYSVRIKDEKNPELERCSFTPSEKKVTCDHYSVDKVEVDKYVGIKKFYYFTGQFDVCQYSNEKKVRNQEVKNKGEDFLEQLLKSFRNLGNSRNLF